VSTPSRDAIAAEHGVSASLEGQGWIAQGEKSRLKGSHGSITLDACACE